MKSLFAAAALTVVVGLSGQALAATSPGANAPSVTASKASNLTKAPIILANRGGGSGNDVAPNQKPAYLG